jgi:hypothetical protein
MIGKKIGSKIATLATSPKAIGAGAMGVGGIAALMSPRGPYQADIFPQVQDAVFGDPYAAQNAMKASIVANFTHPEEKQTDLPIDYYYGKTVKPSRSTRGQVSGDVVLGAYNKRRNSDVLWN